MAKNSIRDFDATSSNNTDIQSVDISEGCSPAGINNAIRELMADIKDVSAGTIALESPQADSLTVTGDLTVDTDTLFVDASADAVGIGTSSPTTFSGFTTVHHKNASGDTIMLGESDGGVLSQLISSDGNSAVFFGSRSNHELAITTNDQRRLTVDTSGNLLVGTTTSGGSGGVTLRNDGIMIAPAVYGTAVSASLRDIQMDSSGFFGYSTSTRATKGNIEDLSDVSWLYNLNPVSFNRKVFDRETNSFKDELSPETEYGLIAEDVEAVNKNLCFYNETEDGQELAGITYSKLITPLIKALQEANAKIETLEARIEALENA